MFKPELIIDYTIQA